MRAFFIPNVYGNVRFVPKCHYCPEQATTRDHIVPRAMVRKLRLDDHSPFLQRNIVPACAPCNNQKADLDSGCECDQCVEAWYMYEQLCEERDSWEDRRIVYTSEDPVEEDPEVS